MTTEEKALALVNETRGQVGLVFNVLLCQVEHDPVFKTLCRAIERHEAELREQAERFSEVASLLDEQLREAGFESVGKMRSILSPFILPEPEPDPLDQLLDDTAKVMLSGPLSETWHEALRKAARGYRIERIEQ